MKNDPVGRLTSIPISIHCPDTDSGAAEDDKIMIKSFLKTMAEIALNAASRKIRGGK